MSRNASCVGCPRFPLKAGQLHQHPPSKETGHAPSHPFKNPNTSSQVQPFLTSIFDSLSSNRLPSSPNPYRYPAICNFTALCQLQLQECPTANFPPLTHSCNSILKLQSTCIVPTRCASPGRRPNPRSNVLRHHQAPPRWGDYSEAPTSVC
jgi:hypothetical protein